jgi:hypothetical protein
MISQLVNAIIITKGAIRKTPNNGAKTALKLPPLPIRAAAIRCTIGKNPKIDKSGIPTINGVKKTKTFQTISFLVN